ncbi:MAG: hypothetical protein GY841_22030 [FCB group bacterium]|nr:hypothetical protein [FCB group bacterium]
MKNRELLETGGKPAPGDLIFVQGFVNTLDIEKGQDEIGDIRSLKSWLMQHGLLTRSTPIKVSDLKAALLFREALRRLLAINNGGKANEVSLKTLNRLAARCELAVIFGSDGSARLEPSGKGIFKALGHLLAAAIEAVGDGRWTRLKICCMDNCRWAFYDGSKNRSGRWCAMSVCGSRDKAREYRKRRAGHV